MAEPVFLKDLKVFLGGYDLTRTLNKGTLTAAKAENPNGRFGDGGEVVSHGLEQFSASLSGFFKAGAGEPDAVLGPRIASGAVVPWPLTLCPPSAPALAAGAAGNLHYTLVGAEFSYSALDGQHGQNLPYSFMSKPTSGQRLYRGQVGVPKTLFNATAQGAGVQLGVLGATQQLVAIIHVFDVDGGDWDITVESDNADTFGSPTTRATFTTIAAGPTTEVVKVAGPIATDTWWRFVLTDNLGMDITFAGLFGFANL